MSCDDGGWYGGVMRWYGRIVRVEIEGKVRLYGMEGGRNIDKLGKEWRWWGGGGGVESCRVVGIYVKWSVMMVRKGDFEGYEVIII